MLSKLSPEYITTAPALSVAVEDLNSHQAIAFDLEFDSHRNAYGTTLCLVQVATPDRVYVVDPLAGLQMQPLWDTFMNAAIQKLVHSSGEDMRLLHANGCFPKNVFDTELAAKLLNYEHTSLSSMLQEKLGYSLDKAQQRSNWLRRPLTDEQIRYAADDVTGLHALQQVLIREATEKGLMDFIAEEQEALSTTIHSAEPKETFLKAGDLANLSPYNQFVLNSVFQYRDELARKLNKPSFQVMDERIVRGLANGDIVPEQLADEQGLYGGFKNMRFAREAEQRLSTIHELAQRQQLSKARPPKPGREASLARQQAELDREQVFQPIQQVLAERFGVFAARFMLSNAAVTEIVRGNTSISKIKRTYRRNLIEEIAAEKKIALDRFM